MIYRTKIHPWSPMAVLPLFVLPLTPIFMIGLIILISGDVSAPLGWLLLIIGPTFYVALMLAGR